MVKQLIIAIFFIGFLSSCSSIRQLNFTSNKQVSTDNNAAYPTKFIEEISYTPQIGTGKAEDKTAIKESYTTKDLSNKVIRYEKTEIARVTEMRSIRSEKIENASALKLKYAVLLNTEVESLPSEPLLETVEEWYGVRYRMGGTTKRGIDCSAFSLAVYSAVYGIMLPRVSRDQYKACRKISSTEIREGDLVFFNTLGHGVSHVGVYLGNNKFVHASVSRGVVVSDMFDPYYLRKFIGAGRIENKQVLAGN